MKKLSVFFAILLFSISAIIAQNQRTDYYRLTKKVDATGKVTVFNDNQGQFITRTKSHCYDSSSSGTNAGNGTLTLFEQNGSRSAFHGKSYFGKSTDYIFDDSKDLLNIKTSDGVTYVFHREAPPAGRTIPSFVEDMGYLDGTYKAMFDNTIQQGMGSTSSSSSSTNNTSKKSSSSPKVCTSCYGSTKCSLCNGKGWYQPSASSSRIVNCDKCHRSGVCSLCKGSGTFGVIR